MSEPFVAEVRIFAGNFAPRGWSFCDGQLLPISQNTALFSLIGTTYGGDGRTTTALPNLQGRTPMHPGNGPGLTSRRLGQQVGAPAVTLNATQIASHGHSTHGVDRDANSGDPAGRMLGNTSEDFYANPEDHAGKGISMSPAGVQNQGGGQSHNNLQPYLALNYIIALVGLYPSRS